MQNSPDFKLNLINTTAFLMEQLEGSRKLVETLTRRTSDANAKVIAQELCFALDSALQAARDLERLLTR